MVSFEVFTGIDIFLVLAGIYAVGMLVIAWIMHWRGKNSTSREDLGRHFGLGDIYWAALVIALLVANDVANYWRNESGSFLPYFVSAFLFNAFIFCGFTYVYGWKKFPHLYKKEKRT